jgi:hypothetical protein
MGFDKQKPLLSFVLWNVRRRSKPTLALSIRWQLLFHTETMTPAGSIAAAILFEHSIRRVRRIQTNMEWTKFNTGMAQPSNEGLNCQTGNWQPKRLPKMT